MKKKKQKNYNNYNHIWTTTYTYVSWFLPILMYVTDDDEHSKIFNMFFYLCGWQVKCADPWNEWEV